MTNQTLSLEFGEHGQWFLDRAFGRVHGFLQPGGSPHRDIQAEISEIVVNRSVSSSRERAGIQDLSPPRRAPTLVTITRSSA